MSIYIIVREIGLFSIIDGPIRKGERPKYISNSRTKLPLKSWFETFQKIGVRVTCKFFAYFFLYVGLFPNFKT
jgi:hypothetical protein